MSKHHIEIHPENSGNLTSNPYMNFTAADVLVTMYLVLNHLKIKLFKAIFSVSKV